jgi:hypothetical protein
VRWSEASGMRVRRKKRKRPVCRGGPSLHGSGGKRSSGPIPSSRRLRFCTPNGGNSIVPLPRRFCNQSAARLTDPGAGPGLVRGAKGRGHALGRSSNGPADGYNAPTYPLSGLVRPSRPARAHGRLAVLAQSERWARSTPLSTARPPPRAYARSFSLNDVAFAANWKHELIGVFVSGRHGKSLN